MTHVRGLCSDILSMQHARYLTLFETPRLASNRTLAPWPLGCFITPLIPHAQIHYIALVVENINVYYSCTVQ